MSQLHCLLFNIDVINMALNEKSMNPTNYDFIITHCENDQIGHVQLLGTFMCSFLLVNLQISGEVVKAFSYVTKDIFILCSFLGLVPDGQMYICLSNV